MPRPLHYIVRPGPTAVLPSGGLSQGPARLVPLITVDQLPPWLEIVGVPRQLAAEEAVRMVAIVGGGGEDCSSDGDGNSGVFEVRLLKGDTSTVPATPPTEAKVKKLVQVKTEEDEDGKKTLAAIPLYKKNTAKHTVKEMATDEAMPDIGALDVASDAREAKSEKDKKTNSASSTSTSTSKVTIVAYEQFVKIMDRLNEQPPATKDIVVSADKLSSGSSSGSGRGSGNGSDGDSNHDVVDNLICIETFQSKDKEPANDKADNKTDNKTDIKIDDNSKGSPKRNKTGWQAQKKRHVSSVKPCRYWCRTGYCAYGHSCRYVHVMPQTPEGLRFAELDQVPDWWVARQEGRDRGGGGGGGDDDGSSSRRPRPYYKAGLANSAMQTFRPSRNWKKPTTTAAATTQQQQGWESTSKDTPSPQSSPQTRKAAAASPVQVMLDFEGVDLVDL
ncbi:hypothetical protein SCUCBS95973_002107 [Sporothrix curviconia]|uniref:C3H1-type domain-containing protein n=1 Tax=Sporothrix curviconia TaxID=1260050 RepID=A0ABP0B4T6_9PEZI